MNIVNNALRTYRICKLENAIRLPFEEEGSIALLSNLRDRLNNFDSYALMLIQHIDLVALYTVEF